MRVFLTGANGYVGRVLTEQLVRRPEIQHVTGIGLTQPPAPASEKFQFTHLDIRSPELAAAMAGHDVVIHTACVVLWPAAMPARERDDINLQGTRNVARAAAANRIRRFIHTSSMAVYDPAQVRGQSDVTEHFPLGRGVSPYYYWNAKALAEPGVSEILGAGTLLTCLRPIYIIGPHNQPVVASYRKNAVRFPGRNPRRQFIHEDDVAAAFILALFHDLPGAYNVVPDDCLRLNDVWKMVGVKFAPTLPLPLARWLTFLRWRFLGSPIHPSWVADMLMDFTGSNARLKQAGWTPRYGSAAALQSAVTGKNL